VIPPVLTSVAELESRKGAPLSPEELSRVDVVIRDVSAFLRGVAPRIPTSLPIPDAVIACASYVALNALATTPGTGSSAGISQESLGGYSVSFSSNSDGTGFSLSDTQLQMLRPWKAGGVFSVPLEPTTAVAW
jgi:hypothetical protein